MMLTGLGRQDAAPWAMKKAESHTAAHARYSFKKLPKMQESRGLTAVQFTPGGQSGQEKLH